MVLSFVCVFLYFSDFSTKPEQIPYVKPIEDNQEPISVSPPNDNTVSSIDNNNNLVYTGYAGADKHELTIIHNPLAKNPSYDELMQFISLDQTDKIKYDINKFTCGDFAETVQHNAENYGYVCGIVFITFEDGTAHSCNVFNVTRRGLIYIDCTGNDNEYNHGTFDKIASLEKGNEYITHSPEGYSNSYQPLGKVIDYEIMW
jgi:hypothetical protein